MTESGVKESRTSGISKLNRREAVARLLAGMAAGAVLPISATAHPILSHLHNEALIERGEAIRKAVSWKPLFLSSEQSESLVALAESIVPGSTKAGVAGFIDLLLSVDTKENQGKFTTSLSAITAECQKRFGKAFPLLAAADRNSLLANVSQSGATTEHFNHLKEWIAGAYYSSEAGMRELGWDDTHAFAKFPGCEHGEDAH
jgi:gluconate 2-dehydrogenase subunit 3-like protein